jgi:hypothetical protein
LAPKPKFVTVQPEGRSTYLINIPAEDREGDAFEYVWPQSNQFKVKVLDRGKARLLVEQGVEKLKFIVKIQDMHGSETYVSIILPLLSSKEDNTLQ